MPLIAAIVALAALHTPGVPAEQDTKPQNYKVLYAGKPGGPREKEFAAFFKAQFAGFGTANLAQFDGSQAKGYDVVFLDFKSDTSIKRMKLPADYKTPTVATGWEGVFLVDDGRAKGSNYW